MASPFTMFRKRKAILMATLCLMAMISFVILPDIGKIVGSLSGGGQNPIVVKTAKYGSLRQSDVGHLQQNQTRLLHVWTALFRAVGMQPTMVERWLGNDSEDTVVNNWLIGQRAHELGMSVDERAVNDFLARATGNRIPATTIQAVIRQQGLTEEQFFSLMEEKLLVDQFSSMSQTGYRALTPAQRWDYFNRLNCFATIEAIPVPVANYTKDVKDPSDKDLEAFFDKYRQSFADPESPEPGFRRRHKVAIEYIKADVEAFAQKNVTDAEVDARFEKDKKQYESLLNPPEEKSEKTNAKPAEQKPAASTDAKPPAETKKTDSVKKTDAVKKPAENTPKKDAPKKTESKDAKKTSAISPASLLLPTALLQAEPSAAKPAAPKTDAVKKDEAKKDVAKDAAAKKDTAKKDTAKKDTVKKDATATKPADTAKKEDGKAKDAKSAAEKAAATKKAAEELKADRIKRIKDYLRQQIAREKIQKIFGELRDPMERYQAYEIEKLQGASAASSPVVARPNFEAFAKKYGFTAGSISLASAMEMQMSEEKGVRELGMSLINREMTVLQSAFRSPTKFRGEMSEDTDSEYLFWKIDDSKERTPKFGESGVREEVLTEWKIIHARDLAWKAAESLAEKAQAKGKQQVTPPLMKVFAGDPEVSVRRPTNFTWLTYGNVASMTPNVTISAVRGVVLPGNDFMRTVFRLEPGHVGVAFNAPKRIAYVVRPSEFSPSYEVRWKKFQGEDAQAYASAAMDDMRGMQTAWIDELKAVAGFEWTEHRRTEQDRENSRGNDFDFE